jgi:streptogramin lyase
LVLGTGGTTWTLTLTNTNSTVSAINVALVWTVPAGMDPRKYTLTSAGPFDCTQNTGSITCSLASLGPGASGTLTITDSAISLGNAVDNAVASAFNAYSVSASSTVQVIAPSADLGVTIFQLNGTVDAGHLYNGTLLGGRVEFHVALTNAGPQSSQPTVTFTGDPNLASWYINPPNGDCNHYGGSGASTATCTLPSLAPGNTTTVNVIAYTTLTAQTDTVSATVTGSVVDPNSANNSASLSFPVTLPTEEPYAPFFDFGILKVLKFLGVVEPAVIRPVAHPFDSPPSSPPSAGGVSIAVDAMDNFWVTGNASVAEFDPTGAPLTTFSGGGLATGGGSTAVAIDGNGTVWLANANGSLTQLDSTGLPLSPSTGYTGGGLNTPTGIAIDPAGSVWVVNSGNNSVTHVFGGAAPAVTPISQSTATAAMGVRP